jgi:hypothetical protein
MHDIENILERAIEGYWVKKGEENRCIVPLWRDVDRLRAAFTYRSILPVMC